VTAASDPYSRVYWRLIDDPKFDAIYPDDHGFATWVRLLMAADMAWPASALLPHGVHRASVKHLADVGLIDLGTGGRYRIHGLDKEREARSRHSSTAAQSRHRASSEHPSGIPRASNGTPRRMPSQDETRQDEYEYPASIPDGDRPEVPIVTWLAQTHHVAIPETSGLYRRVIGLVERHGAEVTRKAMERAIAAGAKGDRAIVLGAENFADPIPQPKDDRAAQEAADFERRVQATKRRNAETTGLS
jgi:hypothetical protein